MDPIALPADMEMVETQQGRPSARLPEEETPRPVRTPRPRPPQQSAPEEPLQQVETGRTPAAVPGTPTGNASADNEPA